MLNQRVRMRLQLNLPLSLVDASWVLPVLLPTTVYFLLESVWAVLALLHGILQSECDWTLAFLFYVDSSTRHLLILQFYYLLTFFFYDSHFTHELLFFLLKQFFLPFTVNIVIATVFNFDKIVDSLSVFELSFVNASPLYCFFQPLTHVLELKMRAGIGAGVLAVRIVIKVDTFVVHQILSRIPFFFNRVIANKTYLVFCLQSFFLKP